MQKSFFASQAYAFLTVLLWSTAYVFTKVALQHFSASALGLLRCAVASLCLVAVVFAKRLPPPQRSYWPLFLLSGLAGFTLYIITFNIGSTMLNATTNCVIISTSPIITALLASALFKERLTARQWIATWLAFAGILAMSLLDGVFMVSEGLAWMLAAAVLISVYNILQRKLSRHFGALTITAYSFFPGTLFLLVFLPQALDQVRTAPAILVALVCFLGIFPSALAYLAWGKALALAPKTSSVANYMFLTPFLALILEYAVMGTLPGRGTFIGGALILAGLLIFMAAREKK